MRQINDLQNGWKFYKTAENVINAMALFQAGEGEDVTVPHTWNAKGGQDGGNDYYRGT